MPQSATDRREGETRTAKCPPPPCACRGFRQSHLGRRQQLARVLRRRLVGTAAAEHAPDLPYDPLPLESLDRSDGSLARDILCQAEVGLGEGGDLGQVGDAEDLTFPTQRPQPL